MAILTNSNPTLADLASRFGPDGKILKGVVELLSQSNDILQDMVMVECNDGQQHKAITRTGLPPVYWRAYNQGIPSSKSTTAPITAACGMMEYYSEVDVDLVAINNNKEEFLLSEESAAAEAMSQEQANTLIYGSKKDANRYVGLAELYSSTTSGVGTNILDGGGTGSTNTSIYLVSWGENSVFCIYPKGSKAGLIREYQGQKTLTEFVSGTTVHHEVLRTRMQWKNGLMVKDWRHVVRIANLKTDDFAGMTGTQSPAQASVDYAHNIVHLMLRAIHRIPSLRSGRMAFYANRSVHSLLARMAMERNTYAVTLDKGVGMFGQPIVNMNFMGIPVRLVDAIKNTEAKVA